MIIDGNKINKEIMEELRPRARGLSLAIVWVGDDPISAKYIEKKKQFGEEIGVRVDVFKYSAGILTAKLTGEIKNILASNPSGIIIQLPLPRQIDTPTILNMLPENKDVDLLSESAYQNFVNGKSKILPPVVASVREVLERGPNLALRLGGQGVKVVVVGKGRLVGRPVAAWFRNQGTEVTVIDKEDWGLVTAVEALAKADIIVSGAGVPGLIKSEMLALPKRGEEGIKNGIVIIDAATSDVLGKIVGDVDPVCVNRAALFSPAPGGLGPITVAMLFKNLLMLAR